MSDIRGNPATAATDHLHVVRLDARIGLVTDGPNRRHTVRVGQVIRLLQSAIPAGLNVMLEGPPGIGKTDGVGQATQSLAYDLIVSNPQTGDPTDIKGMPDIYGTSGRRVADFIPFGEMAAVFSATRPTVWFLDDFGQAPAAVQAACMQLLLARRSGTHTLPDCVRIVSATNGRSHRGNVQGMLEPVKSRFATIVPVEAHIDDWSPWALGAHINPLVIAHLRTRPDRLSAFQPTADLTNSPSPRTWSSLSRWVNLRLDDDLRMETYSGAVGQADAAEFLAFEAQYQSGVTVDRVLIDPSGAPIPDDPSLLYVLAVGLAYRTDASTLGVIATYLERLVAGGQGEFAVLSLQSAVRADSAIQASKDYIRLISGPVGRLILGQAP